MSEFKSIGKDVVIYPYARMICCEEISIGNNVIIDDFTFIYGKGGIVIGDFVHISGGSSIAGGAGIDIEDFSSISGGVRIYTRNDDYLGEWMCNPTIPDRYRSKILGKITLCRHSIIGSECVVLPGVTIGEGASIGANSVVNRDCDPWTVYAGSPIRPIKDRKKDRILEFEKKLISEAYDIRGNYLPKEKWWSHV